MDIVCTICSREKDPSLTFVAAHQRYRGEHVALVRQYAHEKGLQFFLLSGKFGLLHEDEMVPHYDCLLTEFGVVKLIPKLKKQLKDCGVHRVFFHHKPKPSWKPYALAMMGACLRARIAYVDMPLANKPALLHTVR